MIHDKHPEHFIYIVRCSDGTLYTGWSHDVEARVAKHNSGKGSKYTRSRLPVVLIYKEKQQNKSAAMKREYAIKRLSRREKMMIVNR